VSVEFLIICSKFPHAFATTYE